MVLKGNHGKTNTKGSYKPGSREGIPLNVAGRSRVFSSKRKSFDSALCYTPRRRLIGMFYIAILIVPLDRFASWSDIWSPSGICLPFSKAQAAQISWLCWNRHVSFGSKSFVYCCTSSVDIRRPRIAFSRPTLRWRSSLLWGDCACPNVAPHPQTDCFHFFVPVPVNSMAGGRKYPRECALSLVQTFN